MDINNVGMLDENVPERIQVSNCGVTKVELPNGIMLLSFIIPGIKRYDFMLDRNGRKAVSALCNSNIQIAGPGDISKGV
jgi:hypothetical protein